MSTGASGSTIAKVAGGVFATIVAPIIVAISMKWFDTSAPPAPPGGVPGTLVPVPYGPPIRLFNGKDFTGFYTFLGIPKEGAKQIGKNKDPDKVFTVRDSELWISGKTYGALITEKEYDSYHLTAEYKWGTKIWPPNEEKARKCGILLHCTGADDAVSDAYPRTIKVQLAQGAAGDFTLSKPPSSVKTSVSYSVETEIIERKDSTRTRKEYQYKPGSPLTPFTSGTVHRLDSEPAGWQDVKDAKLTQKIEKPLGEWNKIECICFRDQITVRINDKPVNVAYKVTPSKGKIAFQSLGSEIVFRNIMLQPLTKK